MRPKQKGRGQKQQQGRQARHSVEEKRRKRQKAALARPVLFGEKQDHGDGSYVTLTGLAFQILVAYSRTDRSDEK